MYTEAPEIAGERGGSMKSEPRPPATYEAFVERYPELARAWELIAEAGRSGPLSSNTCRLIKLGISIGALRQGAVHAGVRKALAQGITPEEVEQVVALSAGTIGLPGAVAAFSWVRESLEQSGGVQ